MQEEYSPYEEDRTKQYLYEGRTKPRFIVSAANRVRDFNRELTGQLLVGARHCDTVMRGQAHFLPEGYSWALPHDQGFIDQWGQWLSREEAKEVAVTNGQSLIGEDWGGLYSENLY
jgi:hypothetical protein